MSWLRESAGAVVVAALVAPATAAAQGLRPQFGVAAGVALPTGDYHAAASGDGFNSAWEGMALVALKLARWPVGLRADVTYGTNGANDQLKAALTSSFGQPSDEKTKLLGGNVDLTFPFGSAARVQPYLLGGIGVYHITISVTSGGSAADNSGTKFAWNLGGGVAYRVRGAALFVEARSLNVAALAGFPRTTLLPITAGVRLGGR